MHNAIIQSADGKHTPVTASPDAPTTATCPDCGGTVTLRKRNRMDTTTTYFYRHTRGQGHNCPRRYQPT